MYDFFAHGLIDRREFLERAGKFAMGGVTAALLLQQLSPNYTLAQQVSPDDSSIETNRIIFDSPNGHGDVNAYLVRPAGTSVKLPAVLVIHENRGLNPYIEDVARRLGKAGFMVMAPDGLTSVGGYPGNDDEGRMLQRQVDRQKLMNDFFAGFEFLLNHADSTGKVGAVGFFLWWWCGECDCCGLPGTGRRRAVLRTSSKNRGCRQNQGTLIGSTGRTG